MSSITANISTFNFTGGLALTGYSLPISKFTFVASTNRFNNGKVYWDFGDNTSAYGLTAQHYYTLPGTYNVTNYYYDSGGQVYNNTFTATLSVKNFINDSISLNFDDSPACLGTQTYNCIGVLPGNTDVILVTPVQNALLYYASRINDPILVTRTNSWQTWSTLSATGYTINCFSSGGLANFFNQKLDTNSYGHLYPYSSFYIKENDEYIETQTVLTDSTELYCTLSGTSLILCNKNTPGSVFCGTSGANNIYFKHDLPISTIYLLFQFDSTTFNDSTGLPNTSFGYLNTFAVGTTARILANYNYSNFAITSNGLAGDGIDSTIFSISKDKFVGTPINFIVSGRDSSKFSIKSGPLITNINLVAIDENQNIVPGIFTDNFGSLTALNAGGFYKGQFTPLQPANNVQLFATGYISLPYTGSMYLTGCSNNFNIYPSTGKYILAKVNENYDFAQTLKDLRFQDFLHDDNILFDEFLTSIYGNISADAFSLGKVAYERVANFAQNQINIEKCTVDALVSLNSMLGISLASFERNNFTYPAKLKRLVDLLSINQSKLWGTRNKFNQNFNPLFGADNNKFGLNLGDEIDVATSTLTATDGYIIAQEKFSGNYRLCNTFVASAFIPVDYNQNTNTYKLSSYSVDWGWPLTTAGVSGIDVSNYYKFFNYIPLTDNTLVNSVLNFEDVTNTLNENLSSYTDWVSGGVIDNILSYCLYSGVNLISGY